jgi:hypothetical protein
MVPGRDCLKKETAILFAEKQTPVNKRGLLMVLRRPLCVVN